MTTRKTGLSIIATGLKSPGRSVIKEKETQPTRFIRSARKTIMRTSGGSVSASNQTVGGVDSSQSVVITNPRLTR